MRQPVILATLLLAAASAAQPAAEKTKASLCPLDERGHVFFQEVVAVEGTPQAELYTRAKVWSANAYQSANNVTQLDDRDGGRLVFKSCILDAIGGTGNFRVCEAHTVELKESRYRYTMQDFTWEAGGGTWPLESYLSKDGNPKAFYKAPLQRVRAKIASLLEGLKAAMVRSPDKW